MTSIGELLVEAAGRWPGRTAVAFPGAERTYDELAAGARTVARGLRALGVRRGDHVGILMANGVEMVEAIFGAALAGAVVCPVNARYRSAELGYVVDHQEHVVLVAGRAEHVDFVELVRGVQARVVPFGELAALAEGAADELPTVRADEPGLLLTTSGTTAHPKGCVLTHDAIVRGSRAVAARERVTGDDVCWDPLPLSHTSALQPLLYVLDRGGRFVGMTHFEPAVALAQLREHDVTLVKSTFPPVTTALLAHPDFASLDVSRIRLVQLVAPPETLRLVMDAFPNAAVQGAYGLSEGGGYVAVNELDDDRETRLRSVGTPFPGIEIRAVRADGSTCAAGEPGELLLRGFTLFRGYHRDPAATAAAVDPGGWLHTGDRGSVDAAGRIAFIGRIRELIRVGGENVAPAEIEEYLSTHPAVRLVQAVGVPDERLDEVPAVFVELEPGTAATEAELIAYCRGRIASYKVPRHVRFVDEWPMSATKIQRFRLRERLAAELAAR